MNKLISLIKSTMSQDMNLFKIKRKNDSKISKIIFPIFLSIILMFCLTQIQVFFVNSRTISVNTCFIKYFYYINSNNNNI